MDIPFDQEFHLHKRVHKKNDEDFVIRAFTVALVIITKTGSNLREHTWLIG